MLDDVAAYLVLAPIIGLVAAAVLVLAWLIRDHRTPAPAALEEPVDRDGPATL
jgi:phosphate/sulfate permease